MQETSKQQPAQGSSAGYRPLVPTGLTMSVGNSAYAYLAAAASLGMVVGVTMAVTAAGHASVSAAPRVPYELSTHASGLGTLPASYTGPAPSLLSTVDTQRKNNAATPLLPASSGKPDKKAAKEHKKHGIHRLWPFNRGARADKAGKRRPFVSPNAPATPARPTALELATAAAAAGPFVLGIQGDATVASYDVATGVVETYEGSSFVLDKTGGDSNAISWQDFPFNVHYRCDQGGSCTMNRHGATVGARLAR